MGKIVNLGKEQTAKTPNALNYKAFINKSTTYSILTEVVNVTGSGFLKSALLIGHPTSVIYAELKIEVDENTILHLRNIGAKPLRESTCQGITDAAHPGQGTSGLFVIPMTTSLDSSKTGIAIENANGCFFNSGAVQEPDGFGALFVIPELIRFENKLKISVLKDTGVGSKVVTEYYLD